MAFKIRPFSLFKVQSVCLRILGIWAGPENQVKHYTRMALHSGLMSLVLLLQLDFSVNCNDNIFTTIESLILSITRIVVYVKMVVYFLRHNDFKELLETFDHLVTEDTKPSFRYINNSMRKRDLLYTGGFLFLALSTIIFYITIPIVVNLNSPDDSWEMPFTVRFPFDYHYFPMYHLIFLIMSYTLFIVIMTLVGTDGILFGSCFCIAGQFHIVEEKINNLVDWTRDDPAKPMTAQENKVIKDKLIDIVEHHLLCMELTAKVSQLYRFNVLTNFRFSSIVMAMCSLNILLADGMDKLTFISYFLSVVIQLYCICKNGSTLTDASARVPMAIYNFEWYKCDRQVKYAVLTVLMRSQKKAELRIPFCKVSMETFAKYLQSTGSFITLLQSFL